MIVKMPDLAAVPVASVVSQLPKSETFALTFSFTHLVVAIELSSLSVTELNARRRADAQWLSISTFLISIGNGNEKVVVRCLSFVVTLLPFV